MKHWRRVFVAAIGVLAFGTATRADMVGLSPSGGVYGQAPLHDARVNQQHTDLSTSFGDICGDDLFSILGEPLSIANTSTDSQSAADVQPLVITSDGQSSLALCLYALIGLGLCRSTPLVKKLSFGLVPEWFHDGGPFQIGQSFAVSPDCQCSAQVCFVQPDHTQQDRIPRFRLGIVSSLRRKSQFTPITRSPRAPPLS